MYVKCGQHVSFYADHINFYVEYIFSALCFLIFELEDIGDIGDIAMVLDCYEHAHKNHKYDSSNLKLH